MKTNVFAYGTLLAPGVMRAVTTKDFPCRAATVAGYGRYCLNGRDYPGITEELDSHVEGLVYLGVDCESLARLDYFEGSEYTRQQLSLELSRGEPLLADAYVVSPDNRHLLSRRPWKFDKFLSHHLYAYIEHAHKCMAGFEPSKHVGG